MEMQNGWPTYIKLHRWILGLKGKENRNIFVDHKNGWLDNTLESLRPTNNQNNSRYSKPLSIKKVGCQRVLVGSMEVKLTSIILE